LVERVRRRMIGRRRADDPADRDRTTAELEEAFAAIDDQEAGLDRAEALIRAFSLYFQLANLAGERHRVRTLGRRARAGRHGAVDGSIAWAVRALPRSVTTSGQLGELVQRLAVVPVLTAHPTAARRRTLLVAP